SVLGAGDKAHVGVADEVALDGLARVTGAQADALARIPKRVNFIIVGHGHGLDVHALPRVTLPRLPLLQSPRPDRSRRRSRASGRGSIYPWSARWRRWHGA